MAGTTFALPTKSATKAVSGRAYSSRGVSSCSIRPELIEVLPIDAPPPAGQVVCDGLLVDVLYHGASSRWHVRIDDSTMIVASQAETADAAALPAPGSRVRLAWSAASIVPLKE